MKNSIFTLFLSLVLWVMVYPQKLSAQDGDTKLKALIIDGQNNHGVWPKTTIMMKDFLEQTGLFEVDIERTQYLWLGPHYDKSIGLDDITDLLTMYPVKSEQGNTVVEKPRPDPNYSPDFGKYDVIINNFGWQAADWPEETREKFEKYMAEGGGMVVVHAANNSWGDWDEYNKMIGLGGWGGRNAESGTYAHLDDEGELVLDKPEGSCGSHGAQYEYILENRAPGHPITRGLPLRWKHAKDELYERLCGPAENMTILYTGYSDKEKNSPPWNEEMKATGMHEPLIFTIDYGKGRVFHTGLGHMGYSMECVGFMTTFQRGAEWAATGKVTQKVPDDFPGPDEVSIREWDK